MPKALTVKALENLKATAARQEIPDGLVRGLYLVVQTSGRKSWAVRYRHAARTRKLTLGSYPAIPLAEARDLAGKALVEVAKGHDPAITTKVKPWSPQPSGTIESVVDAFIERHAKVRASRSWQETERILKRELVERWRGRPLSELKRSDVHALLDAVVDRGAAVMANRVLAALRRMCKWAVERDIIPSSPCDGVRPPGAERSRDRVLTDEELGCVWRACGDLGYPFGPLIQLLILTGQRRNEVGGMRWSELDLAKARWVLPKSRTKNGIEHLVPLSQPAKGLLEAVPRIINSRGLPVLVFTTTGDTPASGFSKAKKTIDERMSAARATPVAPWTLHDLRRTFASGCARLGTGLPVIEKALNHTSGSFKGIVAVYQRHDFAPERREALDKWAAHVMQAAAVQSC